MLIKIPRGSEHITEVAEQAEMDQAAEMTLVNTSEGC